MVKFIHLIALPGIEYIGPTEILCILSKVKHYSDFKIALWVSQLPTRIPQETLAIMYHVHKIFELKRIPKEYYTNDVRWGIDHPDSNRARAYQSDHIRFCILRDYGGLYCDLDSFTLNRFPIYAFTSLRKYKTVIGMQTSTRYKGTSIHWIYSEPNAPFIEEYIRIRDQNRPYSGSAQNGFQALENPEVYKSTKVMEESAFTYPAQPMLESTFSDEYIGYFTYSPDNYEIHLCGGEGLKIRNTERVRKLLRKLLTIESDGY